MRRVRFREQMSDIEESLPGLLDSITELSVELLKEDEAAIPPGKAYTVNSKRVSVDVLQQVAEMLGLPRRALADELCQLIEGQLAEISRDLRNIQIVVGEMDTDITVSLVDATGVFQHACHYSKA